METDAHLDGAMIQQLLDLGGVSLVLKMVSLFFEMAPQRVDSIELATQNGNLDEVYRAAHALKSSAANLGANRLRFLCQAIELLAHEGKKEELQDKVKELRPLFDAANQELNLRKEALE